jgi:hypothetical protein
MIYNALAHVVALVEADSPEAAQTKLHAALDAAGFEVYPYAAGDIEVPFVSDDQDAPADIGAVST